MDPRIIKEGDLVRIKDYEKVPRGWVPEMLKLCGRTSVVSYIDKRGLSANDWNEDVFAIRLSGLDRWVFTASNLEEVMDHNNPNEMFRRKKHRG